ncbi:MAG TPA: hypothetical protein V6C90_17525 [Coleofasciculaceae cyanobacterium]|jgi:probable HAF family extracellular repeat protein
MRSRLLKNFLLGLMGAVVIAVAISLFTAVTATTGLSYTVTGLGTLGDYPITLPLRINDLGQVIGWSRTNSSPPLGRAFLWQNGKMTNLGTLGGSSSRAFDINNSGQVVGSSLTSSGVYHAFMWQNGKMTDLGTHGSDNSGFAVGINNSGQVVGWSYQASSNKPDLLNESYHAVSWQNSGITDLGTLSGDNFSRAFNINNKGQIFGESYKFPNNSTPRTQRIFRWQNGATTNLGNLVTPSGYTDSYINGINNKGQVVGASSGFSGSSYKSAAYVWQNGTLTNLGSLGGTISEAIDINTVGTVVGYSFTSSGTNHAFVWRNGKMRDLNNFLLPGSGWELTAATGINNKGQIVGAGKFSGQPKAFLLTPV